MDKRGFTLIELLIVVAVIAILGIVATTGYIGVAKKAARSEAYSNLESLRLLEEQFFAENARYTGSAADVATIQGLIPGFQPGTGRSFNYAIITNQSITNNTGNTVANPPTFADDANPAANSCFVATAIGIAGSRVENDFFAIDCNNNRNF